MACVYIRQSTVAQVRFNQESTERQYNLASKAQALGWSPEQIRVLDRDLGQSGARATKREDFKTLVSDVAMGNVGAIFSLEASRLARSNQDWHRLLELCAITSTLVIDEDGCYDPTEFNDGLVLGMKGTFAQAELHIIRTRLHGGKLNKAHKGELRFPLPVGFVWDGDSIVLDPDQEVQGAVRTVFELFEKEGTAYASCSASTSWACAFPAAPGGAWDGKLLWGRLTHSRVLGLLKNPSYAGRYVFGRYQSRKQIAPTGEISTTSRLMPQEQWRVVIPDHHPGYHLGSVPCQPPAHGGEPDQQRGARRSGPRRALLVAGHARVRPLRPTLERALHRQWRPLSDIRVQLAAARSLDPPRPHDTSCQAARRRHCRSPPRRRHAADDPAGADGTDQPGGARLVHRHTMAAADRAGTLRGRSG